MAKQQLYISAVRWSSALIIVMCICWNETFASIIKEYINDFKYQGIKSLCLFQYQSFKNDNILMIQNEKYVTFLIEIFK